jgi:hypothetical protein
VRARAVDSKFENGNFSPVRNIRPAVGTAYSSTFYECPPVLQCRRQHIIHPSYFTSKKSSSFLPQPIVRVHTGIISPQLNVYTFNVTSPSVHVRKAELFLGGRRKTEKILRETLLLSVYSYCNTIKIILMLIVLSNRFDLFV